jgi:malate/lactate dehydrogenase
MKVAVLGAAGGIGQALALLLKTQLPSGSELSLYDIAPVTPGVAVDLSHIPTAVKIKGFSGEDATPALEGADVVLISAGVARKPGMDRSDLFNVNAGIAKYSHEKTDAFGVGFDLTIGQRMLILMEHPRQPMNRFRHLRWSLPDA